MDDNTITDPVMVLARALAGALTTTATPAPPGGAGPWTVSEAAAALRVDPSTLYRAINLGHLKAYSAGSGRAYRITAEDLTAYKSRPAGRHVRPANPPGQMS